MRSTALRLWGRLTRRAGIFDSFRFRGRGVRLSEVGVPGFEGQGRSVSRFRGQGVSLSEVGAPGFEGGVPVFRRSGPPVSRGGACAGRSVFFVGSGFVV